MQESIPGRAPKHGKGTDNNSSGWVFHTTCNTEFYCIYNKPFYGAHSTFYWEDYLIFCGERTKDIVKLPSGLHPTFMLETNTS